jgi:hypothetical protein
MHGILESVKKSPDKKKISKLRLSTSDGSE